MKAASDELTRAEVEAAQLGDRRAEAASELAAIAERLGEEVGPAEQPLTDEERAEIERRLERLERRRAQIGPVNPLAEREYEEAREHVEELQAQREDTERALARAGGADPRHRPRDRARLRGDLRGHRRATSRRWSSTSSPAAAGGCAGSACAPARATATAPRARRPSEDDERGGRAAARSSGVEIEVTPAGKSTRKLSLLSGGEKSLVALAFVFAVFLARPCPFYILDEVEAALDDANIDRFLQLVRRFSDRAQFVVVTHQKRTMDAADVLYGVSMGGDGVTKVVSRRLPREAGRAPQAVRRHRARGEPAEPPPAASSAAGSRRGQRLTQPTLPGAPMATGWEDTSTSASAPDAAATRRSGREEQRGGVFRRLRESLSKSRAGARRGDLGEPLRPHRRRDLGAPRGGADLADVGAPTTAQVVERLEHEVESGAVPADGEAVRERLIELLAEIAATGAGADRPLGAARGADGGRRQRHRQDDDDRQDRLAPAEGVRACSVVLGAARHLPRRGGRAARRVGRARRLPRSSAATEGARPRRGRLRRDRRRPGPRRRRRRSRHGRPPAHPGQPDGRAGEGAPGDRQADSRAPRTRR